MCTRSLPSGLLWGLMTAAVVLIAAACGSDSTPTPTAAPTAVPASDIAATVTAALSEGQTSADDIRKMVQEAVMAAPQGVTAEQLQAQLETSAAGQLSASEVQAIVAQSLNALPPPQIDTDEIQGLVEDAVKANVPEGTSAQEIQRMVQAAVMAATADAPTRGDVNAAVAQAVQTAAEDQLTAEQVQSLIDAATAATNQAIEAATADLVTAEDVMTIVQTSPTATLVVGNLNAFTGSLTEFATPLRNSVDLAADHVNRAGGVLGASMIIVSRDTAVNPSQGVDAARALVDVENTAAIVGALSSGVTIAVANAVTIPKKQLLISGASSAAAITVLEDDDLVFRTATSDAAQGIVLGNLATEEGYGTAAIMYINNAYGEGLADRFEQTFTANGGSVIAKVPHEDTQPTYVSELERATEGNPDVLVTLSYPGQAEVYLREALEGGYIDSFLFADGVKAPELMEKIGWDALDGTLGTVPGGPDRPEKATFESSYLDTYGYPVSHPFMAEHYDATVLIALAAAKAGSTTDSLAIRDALRDVASAPGEIVGPGRDGIARAFSLIAEGKDINYEGASGTVDIDENGDVFGPIEIWKVEGGEIMSTGRYETP